MDLKWPFQTISCVWPVNCELLAVNREGPWIHHGVTPVHAHLAGGPLPTIKAVVFDAYGTLFDTYTVAAAVEEAFPGRGDYLTHVWRQKQLEYSWHRAAMGFYEDFAVVTRDALTYALSTIAVEATDQVIEHLVSAFDRLALFPDAAAMLDTLSGHRLAILSNGSPEMLQALVRHAGVESRFERLISVDARHTFKPHPDAYRCAVDALGLTPAEILLVSSNGFDIAGARRFGLRTLRIERVSPGTLAGMLTDPQHVGARAMFMALRSQLESHGGMPDYTCMSLQELAARAPSILSQSNP